MDRKGNLSKTGRYRVILTFLFVKRSQVKVVFWDQIKLCVGDRNNFFFNSRFPIFLKIKATPSSREAIHKIRYLNNAL